MELLNDKDFKKLEVGSFDLEEETEKSKLILYDIYKNIVDILKKYCDLQEEDYTIITTWIIGTYFHKDFESYPYLFLNAMKGSGKTRTLKLITDLSNNGEILLSPTEAGLFRSTSTLGIDEAEGITRKEMANIRELLNGCYKKGSAVKRYRPVKTEFGTKMVEEQFNIYRPLVIANINGMEDVLGDRCINIILERSNNPKIIKLAEIWKHEKIFKETKELFGKCSLCSVVVVAEAYMGWNDYLIYNNNYNNYNNYINIEQNVTKIENKSIHYNCINYIDLFKKMYEMDLTGREVELCLPLLYISYMISPEVFEELYKSIKSHMRIRKEEQFNESRDIQVIDFVSQLKEQSEFLRVKDIVNMFLEFTQDENKDFEINNKWMGWALRRLKLIREKKRIAGGIQIKMDITKAQEKIKVFK